MTKEEVLSNLCHYDDRNPDRPLDTLNMKKSNGEKDCYCDNCFYGRTKMAEYILELESKTRIEIKQIWHDKSVF